MTNTEPIGLELNGGIKTQRRRIIPLVDETFDAAQIQIGETMLLSDLTPEIDGLLDVGQVMCAIDQQERAAADADIAGIFEGAQQPVDMTLIVLRRVSPGRVRGAAARSGR